MPEASVRSAACFDLAVPPLKEPRLERSNVHVSYAKLKTSPRKAGMAKLADAADLKSAGAKSPVGVRFPLPAPFHKLLYVLFGS